jgi:hypothetical protein
MMAPMTETPLSLADDPAVRAARQAVADLEHQLADAQARMKRPTAGTMVSAPESKRERLAREDSLDLEEQLAPARRARDLAETKARQRLLEAARPAERQHLARIVERLDALVVAVREDLAARDALAARCGVVGAVSVVPELLGLGPVRDRLQRLLDPPAPTGPTPVPKGKVRVRVVEAFRDADGRMHHPTYAGQPLPPEALAAGDAAEAVRRGWAEPVEA